MVRFFMLFVLVLGCSQAQQLRVGLGYLPDVQFAPFYLAQVEGLYAAEGLEVSFQHGFVTELYPLLAQGRLDFVVGDAEDVLALRSQDPQGAAFKYVLALYQRVPTALFARTEAGIATLEDLAGKTVGMPGLFGSSYTSLQAVLAAAGLSEADIRIEQIGFTQMEAILSRRVDVAMGFINNEPIVLRSQGVPVTVIPAGDYNPAPGNGVITTDRMLGQDELVRRFLHATQQAMALTIQEPERAFSAAAQFVENLADDRMQVLMTSLELYTSETTAEFGLGFVQAEAFTKTLELLQSVGRLSTDLPAETFFSNDYLTPAVGLD